MKETYWVSTGKLFNGRTTYIICDDDGLYATARGCDEAYEIADMLNAKRHTQAAIDQSMEGMRNDGSTKPVWCGPDVTISGARFVQVEITEERD